MHASLLLRAAPLLALSVVHITGCRAHVALEAPPVDAPREERVAAYEALRPRGVAEPRFALGFGRETPLRLASGLEVSDPRDFASVLDEETRTVQQAERAHTLGAASLGLRVTTVAIVSAGLAGLFYAKDRGDPEMFGTIALAYPLVALAVLVPAWALGDEAERARQAAFDAYPHDLRERLAVGNDRERVASGPLSEEPASTTAPEAPPALGD